MKVAIRQEETGSLRAVCIRRDPPDQYGLSFAFGEAKARLLLAALKQEPDFLERFLKEAAK